MRRAVSAFLGARRLLLHKGACIQQRAHMFVKLVQSSVVWALGVPEPSVDNASHARTQSATLVVWLLGLRTHLAWFSPEMYVCIRTVAKCWQQAKWGGAWDVLFLIQVRSLFGHICRGHTNEVAQTLVFAVCHADAMRGGVRRRTGTDYTMCFRCKQFLQSQYLDLSTAASMSKEEWGGFTDRWLAWNGSSRHAVERNVWATAVDFMSWHRRCIQGCLFGSQTFFLFLSDATLTLKTLHRRDGWQQWEFQCPEPVSHQSVWETCDASWLQVLCARTVHVRLYTVKMSGMGVHTLCLRCGVNGTWWYMCLQSPKRVVASCSWRERVTPQRASRG